ncbi:chondroitin sulfate glucuronyltransferase [Diabrotica virgifera virgifera]|uniref:Hexosyltransferase n=1 Tax=Diabrotica virgifera virgifera TaxID=50390 RepID=A0ABM5JZ78_DIAVI|nr:chondroitin sulfate glucuronyltransferase [Diabrotica virgifera virgifera]
MTKNMHKGIKKCFSENVYLFLGIIIGLYISTIISNSVELTCSKQPLMKDETVQEIINSSVNKLEVKPPKKTSPNPDKPKLIRPRYYSTELGIREKLFVGVFTSEEKINTQAIHINRTIGHLVDRIKFFITAQYKLKTKHNLTGLVGFTDARHKFRPFQVIKYVADTFGQNYDYFFFANDFTFINAYELKDIIKKISVSMDVYLGSTVKDGSYCNLDAGIILSNSVLKAMRNHLDWCIMNAVSEDPSENIGRCAFHSLGIYCQQNIQMESIHSFRIKQFELAPYLKDLSEKEEFNKAITIYPVLQKEDFYLLNAYFLRQRLTKINNEIKRISEPLIDTWPPGQRQGAKAATRFDLPRNCYFNQSHVFFSDDFTTLRKHTSEELVDLRNIIEEIKLKTANNYSNLFEYVDLINGYKIFDLSRGMDYTVDLKFKDSSNGKEVIKRFEVSKPLGNIELISVPYVTENSRVHIVLPVEDTDTAMAMEFLKSYAATIMDRKEKTFLLLVLFYQYNSDSKGTTDPYVDLKSFVTSSLTKYKNDDVKIAWLSIRLPEAPNPLYIEKYKALNFAVVDLALKKIGLDSLTLVLDVYSNVTVDFLNRVRMNTIQSFQIFSPVPFRQYNPRVSQISTFDVNKISGHFDREEYKYISFYGKDYVFARKKHQHIIPLIRIDNDITKILDEEHKDIGNVFEMFLKYHEKLHCMRATEMNLKIKYHEEKNLKKRNLFLGSEAQLAKVLLQKDKITELF